jgi:hypothetical protein
MDIGIRLGKRQRLTLGSLVWFYCREAGQFHLEPTPRSFMFVAAQYCAYNAIKMRYVTRVGLPSQSA